MLNYKTPKRSVLVMGILLCTLMSACALTDPLTQRVTQPVTQPQISIPESGQTQQESSFGYQSARIQTVYHGSGKTEYRWDNGQIVEEIEYDTNGNILSRYVYQENNGNITEKLHYLGNSREYVTKTIYEYNERGDTHFATVTDPNGKTIQTTQYIYHDNELEMVTADASGTIIEKQYQQYSKNRNGMITGINYYREYNAEKELVKQVRYYYNKQFRLTRCTVLDGNSNIISDCEYYYQGDLMTEAFDKVSGQKTTMYEYAFEN